MEKEKFYNKMKELAEQINISLSVEQLGKFYRYMELLVEWNEKINLTAITEPEEIILKHFIDSITIKKYMENKEKIIDVGTGAGFPGIPLSIIDTELQITLVDSLNKRLIFLKNVIEELELKNVEIIHSRAEELGQNNNHREKYDIATSRAVANLATLSEYLIPFVKTGGKTICMKASDTKEEIENAQKAINVLGGAIEMIEEFKLPKSDIGRTIIIIRKEKKTNSKYPRKAGTPSKEPIK
ncbi:MAG: 16S rRNA (guanine(527)-N(7))-methyltransferase RsmG [Clostridia bacterium]|jgi:16S rRNA (guanine527-N7)-methyltransferase|nr:16S rRNA (guanine(527)-N(7))-methyltransferase RsmG [Clostridia bacterium]